MVEEVQDAVRAKRLEYKRRLNQDSEEARLSWKEAKRKQKGVG